MVYAIAYDPLAAAGAAAPGPAICGLAIWLMVGGPSVPLILVKAVWTFAGKTPVMLDSVKRGLKLYTTPPGATPIVRRK